MQISTTPETLTIQLYVCHNHYIAKISFLPFNFVFEINQFSRTFCPLFLKHVYSISPVIALHTLTLTLVYWSFSISSNSLNFYITKTMSERHSGVQAEIKEIQGFAKLFYVLIHTTKYVGTFYLGTKCIFLVIFF